MKRGGLDLEYDRIAQYFTQFLNLCNTRRCVKRHNLTQVNLKNNYKIQLCSVIQYAAHYSLGQLFNRVRCLSKCVIC